MRTTIAVAVAVLLALSLMGQADQNAGVRPSAAAATDSPAQATAAPQPAAAPTSRPAVAAPAVANSASAGAPKAEIRLQYDGAPINAVVKAFSAKLGRPIIGDVNVEGTVTFFDSRPYTLEEAFETINIVLAMRSCRMVDDGRFLRLVQLSDLSGLPVDILSGLDKTGQMRDTQLVTVLLPLKYLQPTEAQQLAVPMAHAYGKVAAMAKSKGLLITDEVGTIRRIGTMLELLDTSEMAPDMKVKTIELKHASARDVARVITELWGRSVPVPRAPQQPNQPPQPQPQPQHVNETIKVTCDDRTNTIILMGESGALLMAADMVEQLDREKGGPLGGDTRVFQLTSARAEELARTLQEAVQTTQQPQPGRAQEAPTRIVADPTGNRLVVSAPVDQMTKIEGLIETLDSGKETEAAGVRIFRLKVADARQLTSVIRDAVNRPSPRGSTQVPLTVSADPRSNTLIVAGSAADIKTAASLVDELDQSRTEQALEVRVIHMATSDIRQLAQSLTNVLNKEGGQYGGRPEGGPTIRIESDRSSNNLIVAAPPAEWPRIEKILAEMKEATVEQVSGITRLLPLKHASARDMARALEPVFSRRDRSGGGRADVTLPVVISASEQANALLVSASKDDLEKVAQLVEQMDVEGPSQGVRVTTIELTAADAQKVAETLKAMLPKGPAGQDMDVAISADPQTNAVLIRAPENQRKMLEEMIARLDKPVAQTARQTLVHPLEHASATAVSAVLSQLYPSQSGSSGGRRGGNADVHDAERVVITPAPGDKALVIDAPRQKIDRIVQLADSLDDEGEVAGRLMPRSYALTKANARDLAQSLGKLFAERRTRGDQNDKPSLEPEPRFEAEEASNLLLVAATSTQYEIIDKLIQQMESDASDHQVLVRMFTLKQARAADLEPTIAAALATRAGQASQDQRSGQRTGKISVNTDERTNVLIVTAPAALLKEAEAMIARLDTAEGTENAATTEVVTLAHADAEEMATALNAALAGQEMPGRGGPPGGRTAPALKGRNVHVVPNPGARSVLLTGSPSDITVAKSLIALLDERDGGARPETKVYKLAHAQADTIRQVLQDTLAPSQQPGAPSRRGRQADSGETPVKISADPKANAVVVSATMEVHAQVAALLEQLDSEQAASAASRIEIVPMAHGKASAMAEALNAARGVDPQHRTPTGPVPVAAVEPGNCLVLTGRPEELAAMKALVQQLDDAGAKLAGDIKFFPLKHAQAKDLVDLLQTMLAGSETSAGGPRGGRRQGQSENTETVRVAAAEATNSLIVQGTPDKLALAEQMIRQLDVAEAAQRAVVEIVRLSNAQAASLADAVNGMLGSAQQGTSGQGHQGTGQQPAAGEAQTVTVTPETNSNSVLVRGPAVRVTEVVATIRQLDGTGTSNIPQMRTYKLANNDARELADSMGQLFQDMIKKMPAAGGSKAAGSSSAASTPFSIGVDMRTNSLVVSTTPAYFAMFEQLLNQLETTEAPLREVYYVALSNADSYDLSKKLGNLFPDRKGPDAPVIEADSYSNSLTIIAKEIDYRRMLPLIEKIDKVPTIKVQVIPVTGLRAEQLAQQLARVYPQMSDSQVRVVDELPGRGESVEPIVPQPQPIDKPAPGKASPAPAPATPASAPASAPVAVPAILRADETRGQVAPPAASAPATAPAAVKPPVLITVNKRTNALIVSATQQEIDAIKELATQLSRGSEAEDTEIRWFPLAQADPQSVAATLDKLFNPQQAAAAAAAAAVAQTNKGKDEKDKGQQPPPPPPAPAAPATIVVVPEPRTRNLIVKAKPLDFEMIEPIIKQLDQNTTVLTELRTFPLVNTDATELASNLRELFRLSGQPGGAGVQSPQQLRAEDIRTMMAAFDPSGNPPAGSLGSVVVTANRATNSVVVSGPHELMKVIEGVIKELDQSAGQSTRPTIRMYPTTVDDVAGLAATLNKIFAGVDLLQPGRMPQMPVGRQETPVVVTADEAGRLLIVSASAEQHETIAKVIAQVQSAQTDSGGTTKVVQLHNGKAAEVAKALSMIAESKAISSSATPGRGGATGPAVTVAPEINSNSIILTGPAAAVEKFAAMIDQLEQANTQTAEGVFILPLERAKAGQMAEMVLDLHRQQLAAAQRTQREVPALAVTPDDRSNALVISCSPDRFKEVAAWVNQIEQMNPKRGTPKMFELQNVDPNELETALRKLYGGSTTPGAPSGRGGSRGGSPGGAAASGGSLPFEVTVLPAQRRLLVDGSEDDLKVVGDLITALEGSAKTQKPEIRLFELKTADSTRIAESLRQIFTNIKRPNFPEDNVIITALPKTKAVMVAAAAEKMADAERLIQQLDTPTISPAMDFRVWPLQYAQPNQAASLLNKMLDEYRKQHPDEPVSVVVDERTRSLIVSAQTQMFEQVEKLIQQIDVRPPYGEAEVLVVQLMRADAATLSAVLNEMLQPSKTGQVTDEARALQEQVKLLHVRTASGETLPELDLTKPIKIQANPAQAGQGSNSLVITSTAENVKALAAVVKLMDTVPVTEAVKVRLVVLRNGDAEAVKKVLDEVFAQGAKQLAGRPGSSTAGKAEPVEGDGKALVKPLTVSIDVRTNAVVLSGAADTLELAERIVLDLDRDSGKFVTEVRLFKLQNADAARLAPILQAVFSETAGTGGGAAGAEGVRTHVTRLVTQAAGGQLLASEYPKTRPALALQADSSTNTLVVAARGDVMPIIADVIQSMDIAGAGTMNTVRIFPLLNADASRLSNVIAGLYTGPNAALVRAEDKPTVQVDSRTNSLIVSASDKTFAMVTALLEKLDAKTPVDLHEVRLLQVANSDAEALAATMQKLMDARVQRQKDLGFKDAEALRVMVLADGRSNSLIVGGSAESYELIKGLAGRLDVASPALSGQIQVMPLTNASAPALATTLSTLFDRRYQAAQGKDIQKQKPVILSDQRTNSLLVAANQEDSQVIKSLLERLDTKPTDPAVALVVIPLEHNDAGIVGPMIKRLFDARVKSNAVPGQQPAPQDQVDVETDALANALIISASRENLALIHGLLERVDVAPPTENGIVRLYVLENADAVRVAGMLDTLVSKGLYKPGMAVAGAGANNAAAAREKVAVVADQRTNVLIISASKENFAVLEDVIKRLDTPDAKGQISDIRLYALKRANVSRLAPSLQKFFDAKRTAEIATTGDSKRIAPLAVNFTADERTNTLLVSGSPENFNAVESMIAKLDAEDVLPTAQFRVFRLQFATAANISDQIQKLFAGRPKPEGKQLDPVTVVAEKKSNALIVGANSEDMQMAEDLIAKLDQKIDSDETQHILTLKKADAKKIAETIKNLYQNLGGLEEAGVAIGVDERTNSLIVSAGQAEIDRIEGIVKQLDGDQLTNITEIRVFPLKNAHATELADLLTRTLTKKLESPTTQDSRGQTMIQFIRNLPGGQRLVSQALQEGVLITPSERANALIVTAPVDALELLKNLIEALDSVPPRAAQIKSFVLVNADATQLAITLKELFHLEGGSARPARSGGTSASAGGSSSGTGAAEAISYTMVGADGQRFSAPIGSAQDAALTITVDPRTNTLLVGGTDQYVKLATRVIEELDAYPPQERICRIYRLRNAQAAEIESAVRKWLDEERKRLTDAMGTDLGAAQRLMEREVSVVAVTTSTDVGGSASQPSTSYRPSYGMSAGPSAQLQSSAQASNTLLVSASQRYFDNIMEMIQQLDEPPPQVLIDVLLAEITLDDRTDLGSDWGYETTWNGNTIRAETFTGTHSALGQPGSGFNLSVTGGNLEFWMRALESQGRMRVLNRPQILAIDNQVARIQSGQQVPVPTYSTFYNGQQNTQFSYQQVGIILEVIPRISPDGFVRMEVHPEISSLSTSSVQISDTLKASIINNRSATTTITVKDGHSIVVGGLITTTDETRETKVPGLGDIPVLGWLFKSATVTKGRTELLIILTPRIIRAASEADVITDQETRRLKLLSGKGYQGLMETLYNPLENGPKVRIDGVHWSDNVKCDVGAPLKPSPFGPVPATQPAREPEPMDPRLQPVKDLRW